MSVTENVAALKCLVKASTRKKGAFIMYCCNRIPIVELIGIFILASSPSPGNLSASSIVDMYKFVTTIAPIITAIPVMAIAIRTGLFSRNNFFHHLSLLD